ncbi:MAG: hypothetical protein ACAI25_05635 [Planctomycetota bacterium]
MLRATGIGSLPFVSLDEVRALLARFALPFLPELPNVEKDDLLLRRPFAGLLEDDDEPRLRARADLAAPIRLGPGLALLAATSAPEVKVQLAGPVVLGAWVKNAKGKPLGADAEGRRLVLDRIEALARAYLAALPGRSVTVFLDEPGLAGASVELEQALERVRAAGAHLTGVHDCGSGFRSAAAAKPDYLSFDLAYFARDAAVDEHIRRGGALAVGAVSTTKAHDRAKALAALRALPADLLDRSLVTPACGAALLDPERARRVHEDALELASAR